MVDRQTHEERWETGGWNTNIGILRRPPETGHTGEALESGRCTHCPFASVLLFVQLLEEGSICRGGGLKAIKERTLLLWATVLRILSLRARRWFNTCMPWRRCTICLAPLSSFLSTPQFRPHRARFSPSGCQFSLGRTPTPLMPRASCSWCRRNKIWTKDTQLEQQQQEEEAGNVQVQLNWTSYGNSATSAHVKGA